MNKYNIPISDVIRRTLEKAVRKAEEELARALEETARILSKIPDEEIVEIIGLAVRRDEPSI